VVERSSIEIRLQQEKRDFARFTNRDQAEMGDHLGFPIAVSAGFSTDFDKTRGLVR